MVLLRWLGGILFACWLIGFIFNIAGALIHWLLLAAIIVFILGLFTGNKTRS